MVSLRERRAEDDLAEENRELATRFARLGGNTIAILASALALAFSGISLYQTVIKQAHLSMFVPDTISYTRDPDGSFEVFAVPLTVSNSGARDGIVSSVKLEVRNVASGVKRTLEASYFAGPDYFSAKEDPSNNVRRSKTPFAPLSVAGRGSFTGTILFYERQHEKESVVTGEGRYELQLTAETTPMQTLGFLDSLWSTVIEPKQFVYEMPPVSRLFEGRMYAGNSERMFRVK